MRRHPRKAAAPLPSPVRFVHQRCARAFALANVVVAIAIVTLFGVVLTVLQAEAKRGARESLCHSNLKQLGSAINSYAADFGSAIATLSWNATEGDPREDADSDWWTRHDPLVTRQDFVPPFRDDKTAAARQALWLLHRRAGRTDIRPIDHWLPHAQYSFLALTDYWADRLPTTLFACSEDRQLLLWQDAVLGPPSYDHTGNRKSPIGYTRTPTESRAAFLSLTPTDRPTDLDDNSVQRAPYSSTYALVAAAYSRDQRDGELRTVQSSLVNHFTLNVNNAPLVRRVFDDIAFPEKKVLVHDRFARHSGRRTLWHAYPDASQPLYFADGSVRVKKTADAAPGAYPNAPESKLPLRYRYAPRAFEPATPRAVDSELVTGYYAWSRSGLKGVDFSDK